MVLSNSCAVYEQLLLKRDYTRHCNIFSAFFNNTEKEKKNLPLRHRSHQIHPHSPPLPPPPLHLPVYPALASGPLPHCRQPPPAPAIVFILGGSSEHNAHMWRKTGPFRE